MNKQTSAANSVVNLPIQKALEPTEDPIEDVEGYKYLITSGEKAGTDWGKDDRSEDGDKGMTVKEVQDSVNKTDRTESGSKGMTQDEYFKRATNKGTDFLAPRSAPSPTVQPSKQGEIAEEIKRPSYKRDGKLEGNTIYQADHVSPEGSSINLGLMQRRQDKHVYAQPRGYSRSKAFRDPEEAYQWLTQIARQHS